MAIAATTIYECNASATAGNVNGGGFNPANVNMLSDLTTDANTANTASPVVSSVSYNFVAGDVNHWLYIKSGTNWTPGWYKIASVAANKATLLAAIGEAVQSDTTKGYPVPKFSANTVVGCATVGTPTGGVFTIDYSQATTATYNPSDGASAAASTTFTSATGGFKPTHVGNLMRIHTIGTGSGTTGWYEIVSYNSATSVVLDASPSVGGISNVTFYVGGAISLGTAGTPSDDAFFESLISSSTSAARVYIKSGTYNLGIAVNVTTGTGNASNPIVLSGYNTLRGDAPTGSTRPVINGGSFTFQTGLNWDIYNLIFTSTSTGTLQIKAGSKIVNCKIMNTSTTAGRYAIQGLIDSFIYKCEVVSYDGFGISSSGSSNQSYTVMNCYVHDCNIGLTTGTNDFPIQISGCIFSNCTTSAIDATASNRSSIFVNNNTLYGAENKLGIGVNIASGATDIRLINNIIYGFVTGIAHADTNQKVGYSNYNCLFNNTTNLSNWASNITGITLDPDFNITQLTGSTATISGSTLTAAAAGTFTNVVAGRDYIYVSSGIGATVGRYGIVSIDGTFATLTLDKTIGTSGVGDKVWQITIGADFTPGTNLAGIGSPVLFPGGYSTSFMDIGAVQRQATGGQKSYTF